MRNKTRPHEEEMHFNELFKKITPEEMHENFFTLVGKDNWYLEK